MRALLNEILVSRINFVNLALFNGNISSNRGTRNVPDQHVLTLTGVSFDVQDEEYGNVRGRWTDKHESGASIE